MHGASECPLGWYHSENRDKGWLFSRRGVSCKSAGLLDVLQTVRMLLDFSLRL